VARRREKLLKLRFFFYGKMLTGRSRATRLKRRPLGAGGKMTKIGPDCIVSYIDMIGSREKLQNESGIGVTQLLQMHDKVMKCRDIFLNHEEICFWNDSILLLAYIDIENDILYRKVMKEVRALKQEIDLINQPLGSFAICLKGQAFPPPIDWNEKLINPRMNYLQASSLAFANIFEVDRVLKNEDIHWYIDKRIVDKLITQKESRIEEISLYPRNTKRIIYLYKEDYFRNNK
jgi:hypothetical protein